MSNLALLFPAAILMGLSATLTTDLWALFLKHAFGMASPNYCLIGRWLRYMPEGIFKHSNLGSVPAKTAECTLGWIAHYMIGILFAIAFVGIAAKLQPQVNGTLGLDIRRESKLSCWCLRYSCYSCVCCAVLRASREFPGIYRTDDSAVGARQPAPRRSRSRAKRLLRAECSRLCCRNHDLLDAVLRVLQSIVSG